MYGYQAGAKRRGMNWETGTDMYTQLCIKETANEDPLYSTGTLPTALWYQRGIYTCMYS